MSINTLSRTEIRNNELSENTVVVSVIVVTDSRHFVVEKETQSPILKREAFTVNNGKELDAIFKKVTKEFTPTVITGNGVASGIVLNRNVIKTFNEYTIIVKTGLVEGEILIDPAYEIKLNPSWYEFIDFV